MLCLIVHIVPLHRSIASMPHCAVLCCHVVLSRHHVSSSYCLVIGMECGEGEAGVIVVTVALVVVLVAMIAATRYSLSGVYMMLVEVAVEA